MKSRESERPVAYVAPDQLFGWTAAVLAKFGFDKQAADATAQMLVEASVHGLDSHGVTTVLPRYLILLDNGVVQKGSHIEILDETPTTALIDGQNNLGAIVADNAVRIVVEKAKQNRTAWVSVRHSNHIGVLAQWCRQIVKHDMIGIVMTSAGPDVAVHGSLGKKIGSNPICIGAPARQFPIVMDMASSAVAMGKVRAAALQGQKIPPQWGMDSSGQPTTDPKEVCQGGAVLPMSGHKGTALAIMVDILCGLLSGADFSLKMASVGTSKPMNIGNIFGAIRIDAFCPLDTFYSRMDELIETVHSLPRLDGVDRIYLPGEIEFETALRRRRDGIPVSTEEQQLLDQLAQRFNCAPPSLIPPSDKE